MKNKKESSPAIKKLIKFLVANDNLIFVLFHFYSSRNLLCFKTSLLLSILVCYTLLYHECLKLSKSTKFLKKPQLKGPDVSLRNPCGTLAKRCIMCLQPALLFKIYNFAVN